MQKLLTPDFYRRDATIVAPELLGCIVQRKIGSKTISGRIVETEAYLQHDPACHAHRGLTPRTAPMFENGGLSYVYLIYGMYYCFNTVTGSKGDGQAVLIRALEPLEGIEMMTATRKTDKLKNLCSGPGKLCQALQIGKDENLKCLKSGPVTILKDSVNSEIVTTTRIGISQGVDLPYRYYLKNNPFISKK